MALEMAASRLFAPYFGSSIYVWTGLIGSLLFFIAVGNFLGGILSRRGSGARSLFLITLSASVLGGAVPFIGRPVMKALASGVEFGGSMVAGVVVTSFATLAVPLVLLGTILPLATGILVKTREDAGRTAGVLYALSTTGSITGVFLPTLLTLPYYGSRMTFLIFSAALGIVSVAGLARAVTALALLVFIPLVFLYRATPVRDAPYGEKTLEERETMYNYVQLTDDGDEIKMTIDQGWYTYSRHVPGQIRSGSYRDYFPLSKLLSSSPEFPRSVCILGLAGGTDAQILRHAFPKTEITGVEIDGELVTIGEKYMGLEKGTLDHIEISDGRGFLRKTERKFDLIIVDVYNQAYIPFHMTTVEFFKLAAGKLNPGGVIAMNVAWRTGDEWDFPESCAETMLRVFPTVYIQMFRERSNTLLYATMERENPTTVEERRYSEGNEYIRELIDGGIALFFPYKSRKGVFVFTDDRAPTELFTEATLKHVLESRKSGNI